VLCFIFELEIPEKWTPNYTSQQKKRYICLMLNIVYTENKNQQNVYNLDSYVHNK
jgi:hypothetical protein